MSAHTTDAGKPGPGLELAKPESAGVIELGELTKAETLARFPDLLTQIYKTIMRENVDYGRTPGTPKPSLWKPGGEILARWLNLSPRMSILDKVEQTDPEKPYFDYTAQCDLHGKNGFVGSGLGSCNSRETRYAFRWLFENQLPSTVDKSKLVTRSNYGKLQYRTPTPADEVYSLKNTVLKMAEKRAFIDAVLRVTGASRIFTQDLAEESSPGQANTAAKPSQQSQQQAKTPVAKPAAQPGQAQAQSTTWMDTT